MAFSWLPYGKNICDNTLMLVTTDKHQLLIHYFQRGVRAVYKKGQLVIQPQESPRHIYYIETGYVKAYSVTKYGDENLHIIRQKHEIFPLIWTFTEEHREISYEAIDEVVVWQQPIKQYLAFLEKNPGSAVTVLGLAIDAYRISAEHVNTLEYRTVRERAASFLLACGRRFGVTAQDGTVRIDVPLLHKDIASSINASRESTSRELSHLTHKGLVHISGGVVTLLQPKKLTEMV
jgi:CRP-like cAMP-binding protein